MSKVYNIVLCSLSRNLLMLYYILIVASACTHKTSVHMSQHCIEMLQVCGGKIARGAVAFTRD